MTIGLFKYLWARVTSGRKSLTCKDATDFLMAYLDGELAEPVRREFDLHLGVCAHCRSYLQSYKQTVAMGKKACCSEHADAAAEMPEDLVKAILAASVGQRSAGEASPDQFSSGTEKGKRREDGPSLGPVAS